MHSADAHPDQHMQAGLLEHLAAYGGQVVFAELDSPAWHRPLTLARFVGSSHDQQSTLVVLHECSHARDPLGCSGGVGEHAPQPKGRSIEWTGRCRLDDRGGGGGLSAHEG